MTDKTRIDRVLDVIDTGLQTPMPDPSFGEISPRVSTRCARCDYRDPGDDSEFCDACRAYLLGDAPEPPAVGYIYADLEFYTDEYDRAFAHLNSVLADGVAAFVQFGQEAGAVLAAVIERTDAVAPLFATHPHADATIAAAAARYCDVRARVHHDMWLEFAIARSILESHPFAWEVLTEDWRRAVYTRTAADLPPRWGTVECVHADSLTVVVRFTWSSIDPNLLDLGS